MLFASKIIKNIQSLKLESLISIKDLRTLLIYNIAVIPIILPYIKVYNNPDFALDKITLLFYALLFSLVITNFWLFFFISILILFTNVVFLHIVKVWGVWGLGSRVSVAMESPTNEMREYLYSYIDIYDFYIILYVITCVFIIYKIKNRRPESKSLRIFPWVYIVSFPLLLSINPERLLGEGHPIAVIPFEAVNTYKLSQQLTHRNKHIEEGLIQQECTENYKTIVVVLGESVNKNKMGIYGYDKDTTPFLSSLNGHALNAISPADTTRYSVPLLFSKATPNNFQDFFFSHSIIKDLESCGYDTFWISNQPDSGKWNTLVASIANEAKNTVFLQNPESSYDENLLPELEKIRSQPGEKKAIFLHLKGSHFKYSDKYPKGFDGNDIKNIKESYDTSLLYSDYVLSKVFNQLIKDSLLFIYTADHGEIVTSKKFGHGFSPGYKDEYEIPMFIWSSNSAKVEDIVTLNQSSNAPMNGAMFYDLMKYLVGIDEEINMDTDSQVLEVSIKNIVRYEELSYYPD